MSYPLMKYTTPNRLLSSAFALSMAIVFISTADARIGERREELERRLFASGGTSYRDDSLIESRQKRMPYMEALSYVGSGLDLRIYFKTVDGRKAKSSDVNPDASDKGKKKSKSKNFNSQLKMNGWDLHVIYMGGNSVIEVYQRSRAISDPEFNLLLALQSGGGYWKKIDSRRSSQGDEEASPTAFGYTMERSDRALRALKVGSSGVMIFDATVDVELAELIAESKNESAPQSVNGF